MSDFIPRLIVHGPLLAFAGYLSAAVTQTVFHRLFGHRRRIRPIFEVHMRGHHARYPPGRLRSDKWIDSEQHVMWWYALPLAPLVGVIGWLAPAWATAAFSAGLGFAIWWHIYIHKHYHLRQSWWRRFAWFRTKRRLHFVHHRSVRRNYAIVEYWIDRLMGTYRER